MTTRQSTQGCNGGTVMRRTTAALLALVIAAITATTASAATPHRVTLKAGTTARTYKVPGYAPDLRLVSISENGQRFQYLTKGRATNFIYGAGVTVEIAQRGHAYYFTTVSVAKAADVTITYELGGLERLAAAHFYRP